MDFQTMMKRLFLLIIATLTIILICPGIAQSASANTSNIKQLNFVFLHGYNGNASALQPLGDSIESLMPAYISNYEYGHPGIEIQTDTMNRSYPNNVGIEVWAKNIADSINEHFAGKNNLVLIGHSMGGKTALYAVAHNIGNIADKVAMVITINSPVKSLGSSYYIGGDTGLGYWGAGLVLGDKGILESLLNYDSSPDGKIISANKHWMAFISGESSPVSPQFDVAGVDAMPRIMDDSIVPIAFQYADGADVVYYGEYEHGDFTEIKSVSDYMADQILRYIFGGNMEFSTFARAGSFEHRADLFPGTDSWQDTVGGVLVDSGTLTHSNDSFGFQEWEDVVGKTTNGDMRSTFQITQRNSFPILTGIKQSSWANAANPEDSQIYLKTAAFPRSNVQVDWSIYDQGLLPAGVKRDHYEVEIKTGTQLASIRDIFWETDNLRDVRLRILSQAQSPFRWFKAAWKVYYKESRQRQIADEFTIQ
jgi:predicted alpha/beta hydrolase family esterase